MSLLRWVFIVDAAIALGFGLGLVMVPALVLGLYGVTPDVVGTFLARLLGASLLGHGTMQALARNHSGDTALAMTRGNLVFDVVGTAISVVGVLAHVVNVLGWSLVLIFAGLAIVRARIVLAGRATAP